MKEESIVGKKARGFKFTGYPTYTRAMDRYNDVVGEIRWYDARMNACSIKFPDGQSYNYPYPLVLQYIVKEEPEEEQTIEQILNNIKKLTSEL